MCCAILSRCMAHEAREAITVNLASFASGEPGPIGACAKDGGMIPKDVRDEYNARYRGQVHFHVCPEVQSNQRVKIVAGPWQWAVDSDSGQWAVAVAVSSGQWERETEGKSERNSQREME